MNIFEAQFKSIAAVCSVTSPTAFTWFQATTTALPGTLHELPQAEQRSYLVAALSDRIYQDAFSPGSPRPTRSTGDQLLPARDRHFASNLASANTSAGAWEGGWQVFEERDGTVGIQSGGLRLWVHPRDLQPSQGDAEYPEMGQLVRVKMPSGSHDLSPGYYCAFSDTPGITMVDSEQIVRLYWALTPTGAAPAMSEITARLNQAGIPYRFKVLAAPAHFHRADSAVLYLGVEDVERAAAPLAEATNVLSPYLRDTVPMFTLPIVRGLSLAEEPTAGSARQSFGQHRASTIAEALVRAHEDGMVTVEQRSSCIEAELTIAGIIPTAPFLSAGSTRDRYSTLCAILAAHAPTHFATFDDPILVPNDPTPNPSRSVASPAADPLLLANQIGAALAARAFWHEQRCTWLSTVATTDQDGQPTLAHGVIGADLYDGVAGVGLFLALLSSCTGSEPAQQTALAAARQALATNATPSRGWGLYLGRGGVALAAAATAVLAGDSTLQRQACQTPLASDPPPTGPDLLIGNAGAVLAALTLAELCGDVALVDQAVHWGNQLVASATMGTPGWSWAQPNDDPGLHLTGLSHGTSGIAVALMELGASTGNEGFVAAARSALEYERTWFNAELGNWPDLRDVTSRDTIPTVYLSQWCHGAPGIALARLRAMELLGDTRFHQEAEVALHTTLHTTREALHTGSLSYSLCHGIAGNLEVLHAGRSLLSSRQQQQLLTLDDEFGAATAARITRDEALPCGVPAPNVEVPGLLLGTAGIGYHFLRRSSPVPLPSLLLPQPRQFAQQVRALATHSRQFTAQIGAEHA